MARPLPVWKAELQLHLARTVMARLDDPGHPHALILYREALLQLREAKEARNAKRTKRRAISPAAPPAAGGRYLDVRQAAEYCRVAVKTIYNHRSKIERAPGVGKLVFTREALDRWLGTRPRRRSGGR